MSSRKTFATKSLKQKKMQDAWFGRDANYFKIKSTPNDSYSSIDSKLSLNLNTKREILNGF